MRNSPWPARAKAVSLTAVGTKPVAGGSLRCAWVREFSGGFGFVCKRAGGSRHPRTPESPFPGARPAAKSADAARTCRGRSFWHWLTGPASRRASPGFTSGRTPFWQFSHAGRACRLWSGYWRRPSPSLRHRADRPDPRPGPTPGSPGAEFWFSSPYPLALS